MGRRLRDKLQKVGVELHHRDSTGDLRCFICDEIIMGKCIPLVVGVTPYSKTDLPSKIGQLMGEGFMIVVSADDNLCKRCTSLLHEHDRLEVDLNLIKDSLTNYLRVKYQLHEEDHQTARRDETNIFLCNEEQNENEESSFNNLCVTKGEVAANEEFKDGCEDIAEILPRSTESPKKVNVEIILAESFEKRMRRRTTDATRISNNGHSSSTNKECQCNFCVLRTPDISVGKAHSCNKYEGIICENDCGAPREKQEHTKNILSIKWTCHTCNMDFKEENLLTSHMQTHFHNDDLQNEMQNGQPVNKETNIIISEIYACNDCNFKTDSIVTYRDHKQVHFQKPAEYRSSHKNFKKRSDSHKLSSCKTVDHHIDETEKIDELTNLNTVQERTTCNFRTIPETDRVKDSACDTMLAENGETAYISDKITETQMLHTEERIHNSEHFFCSLCSIAFPSDTFLQQHKYKHHMLASSLRGDTLFTTDIISNDICNLQQQGHLDTNKSTNMNVNDRNLTTVFCEISTKSLQVPKSNYNNLCDTELNREHVQGKVTSDSITNTEIYRDSKQLTDDEMHKTSDSIASVKTELHVITSQKFTSDESREHLQKSCKSHSSQITSHMDNSLLCNFAINEFVDNHRSYSTLKQKENLEKNSNSGLEYMFGVSCENIQRNISEGGIKEARQEDCVKNVANDNEIIPLATPGPHNYQSQSIKDFKISFLLHDTKVGALQCKHCGKFFSSNSKLSKHRYKCSENLNCELCKEHFLNVTDVQKHYREKHDTQGMRNNCMHCSKSFLTKKLCQLHKGNRELLPSCDKCGESFSKVDHLQYHKETTHRDPHCRYCGKEITKLKTLRNHELRHEKETEEKFECSECKKIFKTKTGLRHHFAQHTGQYKFCCDYCGRGFMSRMMMEEHRSKHTKEERYICDVCGRKFCFQSTYWIHRKWHDNPFPYKCNFCGRKFRHSSLLAVHKRKHTGERPYKCPHCPLTFPVGGTLKRHIILHTGIYPYNCDVCKRGFTTRHKFALHLSKSHGDTKMLNEKSQPNDFKMVIRDEGTVKSVGNVETSTEWQNPDDSEQVDINFRLGGSAGSEDNFGHLEAPMSCPLVPDELLVGNTFATRVVEIVLDDTSQAVASVTVADPDTNNLPDMWYQ